MSKFKPPITVRKGSEEDVPFVFNSWLKCFKASPLCREITSTIYYSEQHKVVERLVLDPRNITLIACNPDNLSQIYGYVCAGHYDGIFTIHFIYVKKPFRNLGIAKAMVDMFDHDFKTAGIYTHQTFTAIKLAPKYNLLYHPYILINHMETTNGRSDEDSKKPQAGGEASSPELGTGNEKEVEVIQQESTDPSESKYDDTSEPS